MSHNFEPSVERGAEAVLVIGIDPGTTGCKVAFLRAYETYNGDNIELAVDPRDRIHVIGSFPGYRQSYLTTVPTCLVYNTSGKLDYWGHEAINVQSRQDFDPKLLVANWKIRLMEGSMQTLFGKLPQDFTTDFFRALMNHLFNGPRSALLGHFGASAGDKLSEFTFLDVVVAVPPGWTHEEHIIFTEAAKRALENFSRVRISLVSETECALRSWQSQEGKYRKIKNREAVILMDLGGGTACLSGFLFEGEQWVHLESYSLRAGSEVAAAAFQYDFTQRLELAGLPASNAIFHHALKQFAIRKMEIGTDNEDDIWLCPVEGLRYSEQHAFRDGQMLFTKEQLKSYFQPLQREILEKLDDMVARIRPKYCVLVGAYARNDLFLKELEKENERHGMEITTPENGPEVVASGACHTRIEGDIRLVQRSKISVGIVTFKHWNDVKSENPDSHHFHLDGDRRTWYCRVITWVVRRGDTADPNTAIIDHDGDELRRRSLQSRKDLIINEVIVTIEADPSQDATCTVLKYGTDEVGWQKNQQDFKEKFGALNVRSFELDLTHKLVQNEDGSQVTMENATFKRDSISKYFEYKYYLNLSQTDCRMSLQVFSRAGQTGKLLLQYSISAFEVESKELQDEQQFAKQLSQPHNTSEILRGNSAGSNATPPSRRSQRARVKTHKILSLLDSSRAKTRQEKSYLPEQSGSIIPTIGDTFHRLQQDEHISTPGLSNTRASLTDVGSLVEDSPDTTTELTDIEWENRHIAKNALKWLNWRIHHETGLRVTEGCLTPTSEQVMRAESAHRDALGSTDLISDSHLQHVDIFQGLDVMKDDENDLDYDPHRRCTKKRKALSSKQSRVRLKKIRTE